VFPQVALLIGVSRYVVSRAAFAAGNALLRNSQILKNAIVGSLRSKIADGANTTLKSLYFRQNSRRQNTPYTRGITNYESVIIQKINRVVADRTLKYIIANYGKRGPHELVRTGRLRRTINDGFVVSGKDASNKYYANVSFNHSSYGLGKLSTKELISILEKKGDPITSVPAEVVRAYQRTAAQLYGQALMSSLKKRL